VAGPALAPLVLARLAKKPAVIEHHGYQAICPNGQLIHQPDVSVCPGHFQAKRYAEGLRCETVRVGTSSSAIGVLLTFLRRWLSRGAAHNLAITRYVMERHTLPRSSVVRYGIEPAVEPDSPTTATDNRTKRVCFGYVGRFVSEKGIPILLYAARILRDEGREFEVRLVGDGPERSKFETIMRAEHLESCIGITGYLSGRALADAVRDIHVVVMPSIWEETAGLAAIEQMMRGRLVIISDIGGLAEVVGDAGLKCAPGNSGALADCMRRVLLDTSLIDTLGRKGR